MRQEEIETKIAFQEHTIKNLNDVLCEQLQEIERLDSICDALVKRVKNSQSLPYRCINKMAKWV
jgi:SlyX protein